MNAGPLLQRFSKAEINFASRRIVRVIERNNRGDSLGFELTEARAREELRGEFKDHR